jgi:streptogrisin C
MVVALGPTTHQTAVGASDRPGPTGDSEVLDAIKRDVGLDADQVETLRAQQDRAATLDRDLRTALGKHYAGSWFDAASGTLTVAVTEPARVAEIVEAGAEAKVVERSFAELDAIKTHLDALAGTAPGSTRTDPQAESKVPDLASWHVDPESNTVVVTAIEGRKPSEGTISLAEYGPAVRIERTADAPRTTADFMDGGDVINGSCSAGFNLRHPRTGQGYLLTAGHCMRTGQPVYGHDGNQFGKVIQTWFPRSDDSLIRATNPGHWVQGPWVDVRPSTGRFVVVSGLSDLPVGTLVCKSGITTHWTCGWIRAKDETVNYGSDVVHNLTRHSACVEHGDSGGPNVAIMSTWTPEGVSSGAQTSWDGDRWRCATAVGAEENISWYYPIAESLAFYGPGWGISTW